MSHWMMGTLASCWFDEVGNRSHLENTASYMASASGAVAGARVANSQSPIG